MRNGGRKGLEYHTDTTRLSDRHSSGTLTVPSQTQFCRPSVLSEAENTQKGGRSLDSEYKN